MLTVQSIFFYREEINITFQRNKEFHRKFWGVAVMSRDLVYVQVASVLGFL
jgi:hypothetical protein